LNIFDGMQKVLKQTTVNQKYCQVVKNHMQSSALSVQESELQAQNYHIFQLFLHDSYIVLHVLLRFAK
jgi:hypothetical protein